MAENIAHDMARALQRDWEISLPDTLSEAEILKKLTERVMILLERDAEPFFQLMYRLDISEKKLNLSLNAENVPEAIARLIYERQLQKIQTRMQFKTEPGEEDKDLQW